MSELRRATGPDVRQPWRRLLIGHLGVWITLLPVALVAARILRESGGELATAQFLLQYSSPFALVLGTVLPYLAPVSLVFGLIMAMSPEVAESRKRVGVGLVDGVAWALVILGALFTPLWYLIIAIGVLVAIKVFPMLLARRFPNIAGRTRRALTWFATDVSFSIVFVALAILLFPSGLWVPLERITFVDGGTSRVYVLGSSGNSLATITEGDRTPQFVNEGTIAARQVCAAGEAPLTVARLWASTRHPSGAEACPASPSAE